MTSVKSYQQETVTTVEDLQIKITNNSDEKLYQSKTLSLNSQENVATLDETKIENESNFKSTKEKLIFSINIVGVIFAMFMMSLNSTVVAPAMSIIATDLDALAQQTWIATSYLVAVNAFQPISGKFSDIFGCKAVLIFGITLFFIGSLVNALATNISMLIAGRTVQGFGGGGVMSMLYIIIAKITPINLRPRFQSMLSVVYGIASVIGPLLGGAFVDHASWHWDFWFNVILAGISFIILFFFLNNDESASESTFMEKLKRIDWLGTIFAMSFIVCILLALNWGASYGWSSAHSIGPFAAAGVSLIALIVSEGWLAKEPILPGRVLFNRACTPIYAYMTMLGLTFVGTLYFGPVYYQAVFGANSTQSGLRLIPFMVCLIAGSVGSGLLLKKFPNTKVYLVIAGACNLLGYGLFYTVNEHSNWGQQAGYLAFCGFAFGLSQANAILTCQQSVEKKDIAVATGTNNFFMMFATSVGVAIYQVLFATFLKEEVKKVPADVLAVALKYNAIQNFLFIRSMPIEAQTPIIHAYSEAIHKVFILAIAASALGFICTLFTKNVRYGAAPVSKDVESKPVDTVDDEKH